MKIIQPKVELWRQGEDVKAHVARCAHCGKIKSTEIRTVNNYSI